MNNENKKYYNCPECGAKTEMKYYGGTCPECGYTAGAVPPPPPTELSIAYKQLGLLVLDSSGSMKCDNLEKIPKAAAVSKSVSEFFEKMQQSTIDNHFCFAIVNFNEEAYLMLDITETSDLDINAIYNPVPEHSKGTFLSTGLIKANTVIERFMKIKDDITRSVVLIIMTDGMNMDEDSPEALKVMKQLKGKYGDKLSVTASYFDTMGFKYDDKMKIMDFLGQLVTAPENCVAITSGAELRDFFIRSCSKRDDK